MKAGHFMKICLTKVGGGGGGSFYLKKKVFSWVRYIYFHSSKYFDQQLFKQMDPFAILLHSKVEM